MTETARTSTLKPKLFVSPGVALEGAIRHSGEPDECAVIAGEFRGSIEWNGVVQVMKGAKVTVTGHVRCRQLLVAGEVVRAGTDVSIETGLLRLSSTGKVEVDILTVPPGSVIQERGAVLNAALRMMNAADPVPGPRRPVLVVSNSDRMAGADGEPMPKAAARAA